MSEWYLPEGIHHVVVRATTLALPSITMRGLATLGGAVTELHRGRRRLLRPLLRLLQLQLQCMLLQPLLQWRWQPRFGASGRRLSLLAGTLCCFAEFHDNRNDQAVGCNSDFCAALM